MTVAVFVGFQTLLILNLGEFQEFCKTLNGFRRIPVKIHKIFGHFMDFQSFSSSIFYRISNVVHGGVWIFSGIAQCHLISIFRVIFLSCTKVF